MRTIVACAIAETGIVIVMYIVEHCIDKIFFLNGPVGGQIIIMRRAEPLHNLKKFRESKTYFIHNKQCMFTYTNFNNFFIDFLGQL